jgi:sporulation protein YlmC with PRC-barrel domain
LQVVGEEMTMKKLLAAAVVPSLLTFFVAEGLAQTTRPSTDRPAMDRPAATRPAAEKPQRPAWTAPAGVHTSSELIGTRIKNAEGKDIGEIDQLVIDPTSGNVTHVVVGLGGLLGVGETKVVVPFSDIKLGAQHQGSKAVVTMDQAKLDTAPRFERRQVSRDASPAASPRPAPATRPADRPVDKPADKK